MQVRQPRAAGGESAWNTAQPSLSAPSKISDHLLGQQWAAQIWLNEALFRGFGKRMVGRVARGRRSSLRGSAPRNAEAGVVRHTLNSVVSSVARAIPFAVQSSS